MLLPNKHSFSLIREPIVKSNFSVFLPNKDSFLLVRSPSVKSNFSLFLHNKHSFLLTRVVRTSGTENVEPTISGTAGMEQVKVSDQSKRNFLKIAGITGAGLIASQFSPKKAQALILGSSPTTGVVGVKNVSNTRINPATEETLSALLKSSDLTFDAGSLQVKVASVSGAGSSSFSDSAGVPQSGLVNSARNVQVDVLSSTLPSSASTETTLQTISFGGFKFTIHFDTVGTVDYVGEAAIGTATSGALWRIKKIDSTTGIIIQWAGTGVFDQIWDNRVSLSYS